MKLLTLVAIVLGCALLTGCATGPYKKYDPLKIPDTADFHFVCSQHDSYQIANVNQDEQLAGKYLNKK